MPIELVLIATENDRWALPVEKLVAGRLNSITIDPNRAVPSTLDAEDVRILVGAPTDLPQYIQLFPNLTWIQSTWAGVDALKDHVPKNATLTPLKNVFGQAMSEYCLGWILALERRVLERAESRSWDPEPEQGVLGKTMGILGTGNIGSAIAASANQLGIRCRGLNSDGRAVSGFEQCFASKDARFFEGLDYVVSVLPKTPQTDRVIDTDAFTAMSSEGILINIGRGNAVNDGALISALDEHLLRAAILDVFDQEPLPEDHVYWAHPKVYVTSHTAAPTIDGLVAQAMTDNFTRYLAREPLLGAYQSDKGY